MYGNRDKTGWERGETVHRCIQIFMLERMVPHACVGDIVGVWITWVVPQASAHNRLNETYDQLLRSLAHR